MDTPVDPVRVDPVRVDPVRVAEQVLELAAHREPTLGGARLICIDGPAGSGKTTLALQLSRVDLTARVVHMDALYDGWTGLPRVGEQLATLLGPLAAGEPGHYRRYDWVLGRYAETVTVAPGPLLLLEGVGSASGPAAELATALVWVTAPAEERVRRGLARDGDGVAQFWPAWTAAETAHFAEWDTRARADLVVDGTGLTAPVAP